MPCVTITLSSTPHCWSRGTTVPPAAHTTPFAALWAGGSNSSISIRIPPHSGRQNRRCSDTLPTRKPRTVRRCSGPYFLLSPFDFSALAVRPFAVVFFLSAAVALPGLSFHRRSAFLQLPPVLSPSAYAFPMVFPALPSASSNKKGRHASAVLIRFRSIRVVIPIRCLSAGFRSAGGSPACRNPFSRT